MIHPLILAAAAKRVFLWAECIANPLDGPLPVRVGVDTNNIES
jgi:hypothetical protein